MYDTRHRVARYSQVYRFAMTATKRHNGQTALTTHLTAHRTENDMIESIACVGPLAEAWPCRIAWSYTKYGTRPILRLSNASGPCLGRRHANAGALRHPHLVAHSIWSCASINAPRRSRFRLHVTGQGHVVLQARAWLASKALRNAKVLCGFRWRLY